MAIPGNWVEVFRAGTQKDKNGRVKSWTEAELDKIVHTYNSSAHDAPIVIGHPAENKPAWGWVKKNLKRAGKPFWLSFGM